MKSIEEKREAIGAIIDHFRQVMSAGGEQEESIDENVIGLTMIMRDGKILGGA